MTDRIDIDALLAETGWLGRLARRLVASGHDADATPDVHSTTSGPSPRGSG